MKQELIDNNFLVVRNFISAERSKKLSEEFKKYCKDNNIQDDIQIPNTPAQYNYKSFLELLCEKTPEISEVIQETVLPTYCYARIYKDGDILTKHTDRDACEVSLTVHLDGDKEWIIYVQSPDKKEIPVILKCGDALLYLGCDAPHWRNAFEGSFYSQVFLHYVRSRGERSYAYFDKVKSHSEFDEKQKNITSNSKLNKFINIFDNVIPNELCDDIIEQYKNDSSWEYSRIGKNGLIDTKIRNCQLLPLSSSDVISKNYFIRKQIDDHLFAIASNVISNVCEKISTVSISKDSGYDLLKYETGGFYNQHTDSFTEEQRAISCSLILNDDYEGGEFAFFDRELVYKLKKGSAITFPSNFLYPHEIMPVTSGTRYSIITWFV